MDDRAVAANAAMAGKLGMNPQTLERITENLFEYLPENDKTL